MFYLPISVYNIKIFNPRAFKYSQICQESNKLIGTFQCTK